MYEGTPFYGKLDKSVICLCYLLFACKRVQGYFCSLSSWVGDLCFLLERNPQAGPKIIKCCDFKALFVLMADRYESPRTDLEMGCLQACKMLIWEIQWASFLR